MYIFNYEVLQTRHKEEHTTRNSLFAYFKKKGCCVLQVELKFRFDRFLKLIEFMGIKFSKHAFVLSNKERELNTFIDHIKLYTC